MVRVLRLSFLIKRHRTLLPAFTGFVNKRSSSITQDRRQPVYGVSSPWFWYSIFWRMRANAW